MSKKPIVNKLAQLDKKLEKKGLENREILQVHDEMEHLNEKGYKFGANAFLGHGSNGGVYIAQTAQRAAVAVKYMSGSKNKMDLERRANEEEMTIKLNGKDHNPFDLAINDKMIYDRKSGRLNVPAFVNKYSTATSGKTNYNYKHFLKYLTHTKVISNEKVKNGKNDYELILEMPLTNGDLRSCWKKCMNDILKAPQEFDDKQKNLIKFEIENSLYKVARQILKALYQLHKRGRCHGDLHPGNIFVENYNKESENKYVNIGLCQLADTSIEQANKNIKEAKKDKKHWANIPGTSENEKEKNYVQRLDLFWVSEVIDELYKISYDTLKDKIELKPYETKADGGPDAENAIKNMGPISQLYMDLKYIDDGFSYNAYNVKDFISEFDKNNYGEVGSRLFGNFMKKVNKNKKKANKTQL